jgi:RNA polymerase primary sigma factor
MTRRRARSPAGGHAGRGAWAEWRARLGHKGDAHLGEFIEDEAMLTPADAAVQQLLKEQVAAVLTSLTPRERRVLELRFGPEDGRSPTL